MDAADRRETYEGFGNALARGFELAATPALFGFLGYLLDRWLDTAPAFMLGLFVFSVVGLFVKMYYGYKVAMEAKEAQLFGRPAPPAEGQP